MGMSTVHHWNLHKMMLKKLHTLWATERFYGAFLCKHIHNQNNYLCILPQLSYCSVCPQKWEKCGNADFVPRSLDFKGTRACCNTSLIFLAMLCHRDHLQHETVLYRLRKGWFRCIRIRLNNSWGMSCGRNYLILKIHQALQIARDLAWCYLETIILSPFEIF